MIGASLWSALWGGWKRTRVKLTEPDRFREATGLEQVSQYTAMSLSAACACVRRKSETCGTFPLEVVQNGPGGAAWSVRKPLHPLYTVLNRRPNQSFTPSRFWVSTFAALDLWGNAFHEKIYGAGGKQVIALDWLAPELMGDETNSDGSVTFIYRDPVRRAVRRIREQDVIHYRQFSNGQRYGVSAIRNGARSLGIALATEDTAHSSFRNGLRPGGFISTGGRTLTDPQREEAKKNLIEDMQGPGNAGKWKLLEGNFDAKPITMSPEDFELLDSRRWNVEEICRWFDVPPILIGHATQGQTQFGTGHEQTFIAWLTLSLRPLCKMVEEQAEAALLTSQELADGFNFSFLFEALLRADSAGMASFLSTCVDKGIMTRNEARARLNLPPEDGGDVLTVQSQLVPLDTIRQPRPMMPFPNGRQNDEGNQQREAA